MASSSAAPQAPAGFKVLTEGTASILYQADETLGAKGEPVFYNKVA